MSFFEPKNASHSITAAALSISYTSPITPGDVEVAKTLDVKSYLPGTSVIGPPFQGPPGTTLMGPLGITFQRMKPDGSADWLLTAQQNFIAAQCTSYTRWNEVWSRIAPWLTELHGLVGTDKKLASASLQMMDQFVATPPLDKNALTRLFDSKNGYLANHIFGCDDLWHINQGWFTKAEGSIAGKQLNVINIATQEADGQITLSIDHLIRHDFSDADFDLFAGDVEARPFDLLMNDFHIKNKELLADLLSVETANRIKLSS